MSLRMSAVLLAGLLFATAAQAQDPRLRERLDERTLAAVTATTDSARRAGLPVEPLINKALEGASKNAPGPRIVAAVSALARQLGIARSSLGGTASAAELTAAAGALQAGARPEDLSRLRGARPRQSLLVPLGVMTDLVARGVPADTAAAAVMVLAARGATDAEYLSLRQNVERDIAAGAPAGASTNVRAAGGGPPPGAGGAPATRTPTPDPRPGPGTPPPGRPGAEPPGKGPPGQPPGRPPGSGAPPGEGKNP